MLLVFKNNKALSLKLIPYTLFSVLYFYLINTCIYDSYNKIWSPKKKKFNVSLWNKKDQSIVTTVIVME